VNSGATEQMPKKSMPRANAAAREAVISEYLKALKLPAFAAEYPGLVRQACEGGWDYEDFLRELLEVELRSREERTAKRRLKEARFPDVKTLEQLDWDALKGVSRQKIMELATCEFLSEAQDCIIAGPVGTGKTHVATGIGVEAARRRYRVAFHRAADLVRTLTEARDERTLTLLHRRLRRVDLLILDELGFVPFERAGGELLFDLLSERHEIHSTLITTNLSFGEWVQVFGDEKLTIALLDRLGHHAHVLTTRGGSYRTRKRGQQQQEVEMAP
jgi:DNA replication protein DnaC